MKRLFILTSLLLLFGSSQIQAQVEDLGCMTDEDAFIGIDRKNWNNGNTNTHSQGYHMNFTLPTDPSIADQTQICKKITEIDIDVTVFGFDDSGLPAGCNVDAYYLNISVGCSSTNPATCTDARPPHLENQLNFPNPTSFNNLPLIYTCTGINDFPFSDILGIDLVPAINYPACNGGQNLVLDGDVTVDYEVCVTVTIDDDEISDMVNLGMDQTICPDETTTLDAGTFDSYEWDDPLGQTSQMITIEPGTYTVTVSDVNGCTDMDEITINEHPISATITNLSSSNTVCPGGTVDLEGSGGTTYSWDNGDNGANITVGPGTYVLTSEDTNGCTGTDQITIDIHPTPTVTVTPATTETCNETLVNIEADSGFTSYDWSDGNGPVSTNNADLAPGNYILTVTDNNGCTNTAEIMITNVIPPNPGTDNMDATVCNDGSTIELPSFLGTHDSGGTWTDDNGAGVDLSDPLNVSFEDVSPQVYNFTYTVDGNSPCPDESATITVTVEFFADAGTNNFESVCNDGETLDFELLIGPHDAGGTWTDLDGAGVDLSDTENVNFIGIPPGVYNFEYIIVNGAPCPDAFSNLQITVTESVSAGDNNMVSICAGADYDLNLALSSDADAGGFWIDDDLTGALAGSIFSTLGFEGQSLNFTYSVGAGGSCGMDEATITVSVENSLSAGTPTLNNSVCAFDTLDLFDFLEMEDMGGDFTDLDGSGGLMNNMLDATVIAPGTYQYEYTIGDGMTCPIEMATIEITILEVPDAESSTVGGTSFCEENCSEYILNFTGNPAYDFGVEIHNEDGITDIILGNTSDNSITYVVCNDGGSGTLTNDTIHIGDSHQEWFIFPTALSDLNCDVDFATSPDTTTFQVASTFIAFIEPTLCPNESITVNGNTYDITTPMGEETIINPGDCDSTLMINLSFFSPADSLIDQQLCEGQSIIVNGNTYDVDTPMGIDTLFGLSQNGCDSIVTIDLDFIMSFEDSLTANICIGVSLFLEGAFQTMAGVYTDNFTSVAGCDSIVVTTLEVMPCTVPIDVQLLHNECAGGSEGEIGISLDAGSPPFTINWSGNGDSGSFMINQTNTFGFVTGLESAQYMFMIVDNNGMDLGTLPLTLVDNNPALEGEINIISEISCFMDIDGILGVDISGGGGDYSYSWDNIAGDVPGDTGLGPNTYNLTVTDQFDCTLELSQELIAPDEITFEITTSDIFCGDMDGGNLFLENIEGGSGNYTVTVDGNPIVPPYEVDNLGMGDHEVIVSDENDCDVSQNFTINADYDAISFETIIDDVKCADLDGGSIIIFNIEGGSGNYTVTVNGNSVAAPYNVTNLDAGNYEIIVSDENDCEITQTVEVMEDEQITFDITTADITCGDLDGGNMLIENIQGGSGDYVVNVDGNIILPPYMVDNLSIGDHIIIVMSANVPTDENCEEVAFFEIMAEEEITFDLTSEDSSCVEAENGSISIDNIMGGTAPYTVMINGTVATDPSSINQLAGGLYDIVVTDDNDCSATAAVNIMDLESPEILDFQTSYTITEGESVILEGNFLEAIDRIEWSGDPSLDCTDCANPTATPLQDASYTITVFDTNGCSESLTITVIVGLMLVPDGDLYVPNVFSPNGDGFNDSFDLLTGPDSNITILDYLIYDRWGNLLYDNPIALGAGNGWNGIFNDEEIQPGVFVYLIRYQAGDSEPVVLRGDVTLVK